MFNPRSVIIGLVFCTSTYAQESHRKAWSIARFVAEGAAVGATLYDIHETQAALSSGAVELNPLFGQHPSTGRMLAITMPVDAIPMPFRRAFARRTNADKASVAWSIGCAVVHIVAGRHDSALK